MYQEMILQMDKDFVEIPSTDLSRFFFANFYQVSYPIYQFQYFELV